VADDDRKTETLAREAPRGGTPASGAVSLPRGVTVLPAYYKLGNRLAAGAMGAVYKIHDTRIERDVALKTMLDIHLDDEELRARFEHEVRVQGQLEHPAIVPVYDVVTTEDGTAFFTMRRVQGRSLREVIDGIASRDAAMEKAYGRRRLLGAFATVCNAVAFAHSRGVIHRDIKPSNIMLGDYGEVYLLDWGVAHVANIPDSASRRSSNTTAGLTEAGDVIGTIGYMAPEQLRGDPIDGRADVYALGSTLFEILTLEPLHVRDTNKATTTTLAGLEPKDFRRAIDRDAPPELVDLCVRATELDIEKRVPDAKSLHDAVEAYLDGQRDRDARHRQSIVHAERARAASVDALVGGDGSAQARETALQEANRALALDPKNEDARHVLHVLVAGASGGIDEADEAVLQLSLATRRLLARNALILIGSWFVGLVLMGFIGAPVGTLAIFVAAAGLVPAGIILYMHGKKQTRFTTWGALISVNLACATSSALLGPFIVFPSIFSTIAIGYEMSARPREWAKKHEPNIPAIGYIATIVSMVTFLAVALIEFSGWIRPSLAWHGEDIVINPRIVDVRTGAALGIIVVAQTIAVAAPALVVMRARDHIFEVQRRAFDAAARVRQLLPKETRAVAGDLGALADEREVPPAAPSSSPRT
jgi:serine/threonine-protein kinase